MGDYKKYIEFIKNRLSKERFNHSLNVSKKAKELALKYNSDPERAELAGLIHDINKEIDDNEHLEIMAKNGLKFTEVEKKIHKLWHSITASVYIETEFNIKDKEILNSVRYHTSGRANMSLAEKVIFVADFISDDRDYNGIDEIKLAADISLEHAMLKALSWTIRDLIKKEKFIYQDTFEAYNEIVLNIK